MALHQLEPGITYRPSIWNFDLVASVRYPLIVATRDWLNIPTVMFGADYWVYLVSLGVRFGAAQFPSLESGQRLSPFSSVVIGIPTLRPMPLLAVVLLTGLPAGVSARELTPIEAITQDALADLCPRLKVRRLCTSCCAMAVHC